MPRIDDYDPEDKDKQQTLQTGELGGGPMMPQAQAGVAPAPNQGVPQGQANFASYFGANQGAADKMAGGLAGGLESAGNKVQSGLASTQGAFGAGLDAGTPDWMKPGATSPAGAVNKKGQSAQTSGISGGIAPIGTNTTQRGTGNAIGSISADEATNRAGAKYGGPGSLADVSGSGWSDLVKAATDAQTNVNQTGSEGGLQALQQDAQKKAGNSSYGTGASRFDSGLAQASGGDQFAALRGRFGGLSNQLNAANAASQKQAGQRSDAINMTAAGYGSEAKAQPPPLAVSPTIDPNVAPKAADKSVTEMAGMDDPDRYWFGGADPVWGTMNGADSAAVQNAHDTMSPQGYRDWLKQFKTKLKTGWHSSQTQTSGTE